MAQDPPSAENTVNNSSAVNRQALPGPYVDQSLTLANVDSSPAPDLDVPPPSGSRTLGGIRPVYSNDQKEDIENTAAATENVGVDPPPNTLNKWGISTDTMGINRSRDPYRNNGMEGFLRNPPTSFSY